MRGWLIGGGLVAALVLGVYWLSRPEPVAVELVEVSRGVVEETAANTRAGTVEACQRSRLSLPIGGQIDQLAVEEGDRVEAGQLLMSLWNLDRKAQLQEARAALVAAGAEQRSACATARSDRREAQRLARLVERGLTSRESADLAEARAEAGEAACEAADARRTQADARVQTADAVLEQTQLRAPFDGVVAEVTGEVGEYATPSPPGVATPPAIDLMTDDCHYVAAPIDEVDASAIKVGMTARVTLDAFRDRAFDATVTRIAPYVLDLEKQARTVEVEAELVTLPGDVRLLTGYSADLEIILERREDALRVPTELVIDGNKVMVVNDDDRLAERPIETGLANWRYTEVVSGLVAGERIVANVGTAGVTTGAPARVQESSAGEVQ